MRALAISSIALLLLAGCAEIPPPDSSSNRLLVKIDSDGSRLVGEETDVRLAALDPWRVARLARALFPHLSILTTGTDVTLTLDSPESVDSMVKAARWADGMIRARKKLAAGTRPNPSGPAGTVAEELRRWLLSDVPIRTPDWGVLSRALENRAVWKASPVTAGMGAVVFAGMVLRAEASGMARERAAGIFDRTFLAGNVPPWLSWIAYRAWSSRDFFARDDNTKAASSSGGTKSAPSPSTPPSSRAR